MEFKIGDKARVQRKNDYYGGRVGRVIEQGKDFVCLKFSCGSECVFRTEILKKED